MVREISIFSISPTSSSSFKFLFFLLSLREEHYGDRSFLYQSKDRFGDDLGETVWEACNTAFDRLPLSCVIVCFKNNITLLFHIFSYDDIWELVENIFYLF